jgi:hypothetical protein
MRNSNPLDRSDFRAIGGMGLDQHLIGVRLLLSHRGSNWAWAQSSVTVLVLAFARWMVAVLVLAGRGGNSGGW